MIEARSRVYFRRSEDERRLELIEATLEAIAEEGILGATVRKIAARTEVTAGLIRHYFSCKDALVHESYRVLVQRMVILTREAVARETEPLARLRAFIHQQFSCPLYEGGFFRQWAVFISLIHLDPVMARIHHEGFTLPKREVEALVGPAIATTGQHLDEEEVTHLSYAVNGVLEGLWVGGCLHQSRVDGPDFERVAITAVEKLLGIRLPEIYYQEPAPA